FNGSFPGRNARWDGRDDLRRHFELGVAIPDAVAARNPAEVGIDGPDAAVDFLGHQEPDRPIEAGIRIRRYELGSERWVAEHQQRGRPQLDAGSRGELRLVDLGEEANALVGNVLLDAVDGFVQRIGALDSDDAVMVVRARHDDGGDDERNGDSGVGAVFRGVGGHVNLHSIDAHPVRALAARMKNAVRVLKYPN